MKNPKVRQVVLPLITAMIWGSSFVTQSLSAGHLGCFSFNALRSIPAALALLLLLLVVRRIRPREKYTAEEKRALLRGGLICGFFLTLGVNLQQFGIETTTAGKAGFITALYVVLVPIAGLAFGRKPRWWVWLSVAMSAAGLWLLCMTGAEGLSLGDSLVLLCALAFTGHILCADHFSPLVDGVKLSCIQFFTCGVLSFIPMLLEHPNLGAILSAAVPILYAGVLSSGVAYTLQIVAQKDTDPTVASLILCLESVFAVLAGALVLHQIPTGRELAGCVLMFVAIVLAQRE